VLLGKLVTTEYAVYTPNETRHPLHLAHTPGGSSSGTAAAVADAQVPLGFGNQTAGSLIRPAAFCGIYALKPSHGLADQTGILPLQPFFDTLGYMARSIEDLQTFFGVVTASNQTAQWEVDRMPRIGLCRTYQWSNAQPETRYILEQTASQLRAQGAQVVDFQLPEEFAELAATHSIILHKGISESLQADYLRAGDRMSERLQSMIKDGMNLSANVYASQRAFAEKYRASVNAVLGEFDALLCPSTPGEAPIGMATGDPIFQIVWTLLGVPCLNLPVGSGPSGLPVGVQLIGKRHLDAQLLALGKYLAQRLSHVSMASAVHVGAE
jgi:Asp-tRNA(Asn)/Glu-tRNA(Gln) amidotransferase A subunit family amidase